MIGSVGLGSVGSVVVSSVDGRGWTPEEIAERALDKIIYVGKESHPAIVDQANAFKEQIRGVLQFYLREAATQERATICAKLQHNGNADIANLVRSI
jgi:hypothetical protein